MLSRYAFCREPTTYRKTQRSSSKAQLQIYVCSVGAEDSVHFIAECGALNFVRQRYLAEIENELMSRSQLTAVKSVTSDISTQLILDCTSVIFPAESRGRLWRVTW